MSALTPEKAAALDANVRVAEFADDSFDVVIAEHVLEHLHPGNVIEFELEAIKNGSSVR